MKRILLAACLLLTLSGLAQQPVSSSDRQVVFKNVNVIPMDREGVLERQDVIVRAGRIQDIGPAGSVRYDRNAVVVEAAGKFLMPGLAEMHAHVPPDGDIESAKNVFTLFLVNGITTIRGMLGHPNHLVLRTGVQRGEILGPNLYTTGPSFNGMSVKSPEEGAAMVRRQKEAGYDYLKLHPGLTRPKFDAIAAAAKQVDIPFVGHVSYGVGVWRAIEAGYSSIDHLDGFTEGLVPNIEKIPEPEAGLFGMYVADKVDRGQIPRLMKSLKDNNIWVVPTQSLAERWFSPDYSADDFQHDPHNRYMPEAITRQWINSKNSLMNNPKYDAEQVRRFVQLRRELILECQRSGVGLLLGCDAPQIFNVPGFSTHNELEYLVKSGLTPYEALVTGTVNVARYLGRPDAGLVAKDAVSDLILLDGNPLEDINNVRKISGVFIGDKWLDATFIEAALKKLETAQ